MLFFPWSIVQHQRPNLSYPWSLILSTKDPKITKAVPPGLYEEVLGEIELELHQIHTLLSAEVNCCSIKSLFLNEV